MDASEPSELFFHEIEQVPTPTILRTSPDTLDLTIACDTDTPVAIWWTDDGSDPSLDSPRNGVDYAMIPPSFTNDLAQSMKIRARAFKDGWKRA